MYVVVSQKLWQILVARLEQNGEITAVDDLHTECMAFAHQVAKVGIHLRRAAGQVDHLDIPLADDLKNQVDGGLVHQLGAGGASIHMAVHTTQVAQIPQVYLQHGSGMATQWRKIRAAAHQ